MEEKINLERDYGERGRIRGRGSREGKKGREDRI